MATYDHKQVIADYGNGKLTPEMAVGHSLQHIDKLYETQAVANNDRRAEQAKLDALEKRVNAHQATIDRLLTFMKKLLAKSKQNPPNQPKPDQS